METSPLSPPFEPPFSSGMDAGARARLGGPGLRTFLNVADLWGLTEKQRLATLGHPPRSTYYAWAAKARAGAAPALPFDVLLRISAVLGVHKALSILFLRHEDAAVWLRAANQGPTFGGRSPLGLLTDGGQDGLMLVRRHLDAWRGGVFAAPVAGLDVASLDAAGLDVSDAKRQTSDAASNDSPDDGEIVFL